MINSRAINNSFQRLFCLAVFVLGFSVSIRAEVRLPKVFSDHMVLQRDKPIQIWGWASPNESVTVQLSDSKLTTKANAEGEWNVALPAMKTGGPLKRVAMWNTLI